MMKERPILFSGPMVRAILDGSKTQTRRIVKPTMTAPRVAPVRMEPWIINGEQQTDDQDIPCWAGFHPEYPGEAKWFSCPYGKDGDRLWVRETFNRLWFNAADGWQTAYRADTQNDGPVNGHADAESHNWKPSIHMPRAASRITLEIVSVGVERLQDITEADAIAEGIPFEGVAIARGDERPNPIPVFARLWDQINGKRGYTWASSPWVWVVEFKRLGASNV